MKLILFSSIAISLLLISSCTEEGQTPKPRVYPKVEYPTGEYQTYTSDDCPFQFEIPDYVEILRNPKYKQFNPPHDCWFNISYPMFQAQLYCSYAPLEGKEDFNNFKTDAYDIVDQINRRSDYMEEYRYNNKNGVGGVIFDFSGPAASPMQAFLSDSSQHFFKIALYYDTQNKPDSLGPISSFIKEDMFHLLESFQWQEE